MKNFRKALEAAIAAAPNEAIAHDLRKFLPDVTTNSGGIPTQPPVKLPPVPGEG